MSAHEDIRTDCDSGRLMRFAVQGAVASAAGTVIVLCLFKQSDTWGQLAGMSWRGIAGLFGLSVGVWLFNACRLMVLARALGNSLSLRAAVCISSSVEFGIAASPGGAAGPVVLVHRLTRHGLSAAQAGTVLAANIALDGIFFLLLLPAGIYLMVSDERWRETLRLVNTRGMALTGLALLLIVLALGWLVVALWRGRVFRGRQATRFGAESGVAIRLRRAGNRLAAHAAEWWRGLRFLASRRRAALAAALALAALQLSCRYGILPLALLVLGTPCHPVPLVLMQGAVFALSTVVVAPGGGGVAELLASLLLRHLAPTSPIGPLVAVWRLFTYHVNLVGGGAVFLATLQRR
jgi:uncharacterized protein (TIRG00374 family)